MIMMAKWYTVFGDLVDLKLPDICLTGEKTPEKPHPGSLCRSNSGPLRDRRACYRLLHSGGVNAWYIIETIANLPVSRHYQSLLYLEWISALLHVMTWSLLTVCFPWNTPNRRNLQTVVWGTCILTMFYYSVTSRQMSSFIPHLFIPHDKLRNWDQIP